MDCPVATGLRVVDVLFPKEPHSCLQVSIPKYALAPSLFCCSYFATSICAVWQLVDAMNLSICVEKTWGGWLVSVEGS